MRQTGLSRPSVWRWQDRYLEAGVDGLPRDKTRPWHLPLLEERKVTDVIRRTLHDQPPVDAAICTVRAMAKARGDVGP